MHNGRVASPPSRDLPCRRICKVPRDRRLGGRAPCRVQDVGRRTAGQRVKYCMWVYGVKTRMSRYVSYQRHLGANEDEHPVLELRVRTQHRPRSCQDGRNKRLGTAGSQSVAPSDVVARTSGRVRLHPMFRTQNGSTIRRFFQETTRAVNLSACWKATRTRSVPVRQEDALGHKLERTTIQICVLSKG